MAEHFTRFTANFFYRHSKNNKKTTGRTISAIWSIFADLNSPLSPKLPDQHALVNIDGGKHVLACFEHGIILNE